MKFAKSKIHEFTAPVLSGALGIKRSWFLSGGAKKKSGSGQESNPNQHLRHITPDGHFRPSPELNFRDTKLKLGGEIKLVS